MVLLFEGCLAPGVGVELVGCLCGAPGPVVVVVVGVVPEWVVPGWVVPERVVPVPVVEVVVVVVVVVVELVGVEVVDPEVVVEVDELVEEAAVVVVVDELVVDAAEQPATTWSTEPASASVSAGVGESAASSAPVVGTGSPAGISNGIVTPPGELRGDALLGDGGVRGNRSGGTRRSGWDRPQTDQHEYREQHRNGGMRSTAVGHRVCSCVCISGCVPSA